VARTYAVWAVLLDRLVLLDAPEPVLTSRIRGRHKPGDVFRQMADGEIRDLVARYRIAFERVLGGLARAAGHRRSCSPPRKPPPAVWAMRCSSCLRSVPVADAVRIATPLADAPRPRR